METVMYVKIYHPSGGVMLTEMTKRQLDRAKRANLERTHLVVSGAEAHQWVRNGGVHSTPLYIDANDRIRYARDAS
jgi:hypothetical protein